MASGKMYAQNSKSILKIVLQKRSYYSKINNSQLVSQNNVTLNFLEKHF